MRSLVDDQMVLVGAGGRKVLTWYRQPCPLRIRVVQVVRDNTQRLRSVLNDSSAIRPPVEVFASTVVSPCDLRSAILRGHAQRPWLRSGIDSKTPSAIGRY